DERSGLRCSASTHRSHPRATMTSDHQTRQSTPPRANATPSVAAPVPGKQTLSEHTIDRFAVVQQRAASTDVAADSSPGVAAPPTGPDVGRGHAVALDGARDHGTASAG